MKICFVGPLLDFSGFAAASRNLLKTLLFGSNNSGVELVARTLRYDQADMGSEHKQEAWLPPLLKKDLQDVDMLIQSTTCNIEAVPKPGVCNALYTFFELDRIPTAWAQKANEFDFIIVPCKFNAQTLVNCGVTKPILIMPPPCDIDIYDKFLTPDIKIPNVENRTIFYNICQLSAKKGIDLLLRSYFAAFADRPDEVLLILKTYVNMSNRQNEKEIVKNFINQVKTGCHIPIEKLPPVMAITRIMSDEEIRGIHKASDCYVNASRGEGWCLPAFDALAFGKTLITNNYGGMADYVSQENALIYGGTLSHVYNAPHPESFLYTGISRWFEPSTTQMADLMRHFHLLKRGAENKELNEVNQKSWDQILTLRKNGIDTINKFDYRNVGKLIFGHILSGLNSWKETGKVAFGGVKNE
jgi:glycosyltransferase involved in cell wall biosynthesis